MSASSDAGTAVQTAPGELTAVGVLATLRACGITHMVWLPDSESGFLYEAVVADPTISLVPVCREGESFAIALGLYVGGATPAVVIQNTGFLESGDSVRGLVIDSGLPCFIMIGYRGWQHGGPMTDSAGQYLEPILDAWGIPSYLVEDDSHLDRITQAFEQSRAASGPVAVLIGREYRR